MGSRIAANTATYKLEVRLLEQREDTEVVLCHAELFDNSNMSVTAAFGALATALQDIERKL